MSTIQAENYCVSTVDDLFVETKSKNEIHSSDEMQTVVSSSDPVCPVGYINFTKLRLAPKDKGPQYDVVVKTSLDYLSDLNESSYNDLSDPDLSESELEQIEMENRLKEVMTKDDLVCSRSNSLTQCTTSPVKILQSKAKSCEDMQPLNSPLKVVHEQMDIRNRPNYVFNSSGWMWISGIEGYGTTAKEGMENALEKVKELLYHHDYKLNHVCYTTLYIRNMSDYVSLNRAYSDAFNFTNPPTRVCVECPLPSSCEVIMEVVAFKATNELSEMSNKRTTIHVQGISHWAPCNIGPYSQSTKVGDITYISGQIALVPGSMKIIDGGIKYQCKLTLRHINRISKAIHAQGQLRDVVQGICFVTHPNYISEARRQWEKCTTNAIVDYIVCPALPRQALVEWQVWAHSHNDNFDYEETGCSVGEFTVFSRRRWNYECNCAAIVCYVTTGLASSTQMLTNLTDDTINRHYRIAQRLSAENIDDILTYTVNKLIKGQQIKTDADADAVPVMIPSIHLKIFYQVHAISSVQFLMQSIQEFREKSTKIVNFAFTLIPACSLQNFSTFLSISGVKHE